MAIWIAYAIVRESTRLSRLQPKVGERERRLFTWIKSSGSSANPDFLLLFLFIYFCFVLVSGDARRYSWFCIQESVLVALRGPYRIPRIEPASAAMQGKCPNHRTIAQASSLLLSSNTEASEQTRVLTQV